MVTEIEVEPKLVVIGLKVSNFRLYMIFWMLKAILSTKPRPRHGKTILVDTLAQIKALQGHTETF